jgi:hypothetical protein
MLFEIVYHGMLMKYFLFNICIQIELFLFPEVPAVSMVSEEDETSLSLGTYLSFLKYTSSQR